ncbi:MAG: coenzyme F420-0:L-glutamate ligase [Alphaproteobacteria bacterium]|nr:coenzyme F420-0:L-glutamate ligase [Alphaproteobacteria bacterium]
MTELRLTALAGLPMFAPGDDLAGILGDAMAADPPGDGDVLVVAQKIVSKAEGRIVEIASVTPSPRAEALAAEVGKDPRVVEVILGEAARVVRARPNLIIVEHKRGWVMANAGIDQSNVNHEGGGRLLLLPEDPDASAERLRAALSARFGVRLGVVINDSFGRAWRRGTAGIAIGAAGLPGLIDLRGKPDLFGRILEVSIIGYADEVAAAASLLMGQAAEGRPAVLVRGLAWTAPEGTAADLVRPPAEDLFR